MKRLISDQTFRAEMELCHTYGMPHSQFPGAGDGRWTVLDRAKALAWLAYTRAVCSGCGTRADEWRPELGGDRFAYVAGSTTYLARLIARRPLAGHLD